MANRIVIPVAATGTYTTNLDWLTAPPNTSYAVELAAGATASWTASYSLDDPNDLTWTQIFIPDPTNGTAQSATQGGFYGYPVQTLKIVFSALTGTARIVVLQGMSAR